MTLVQIKEEDMFWPFDFSTQAWDVDGASIYVADSSKVQVKKGREESFSVPLNSLEADVRSCKRGGNPDESCNNHITNVQVCPDMEAQLVACGTNALQPEVFFLDNATYSGKRHTHQLCPKSSEIDALVQVTSCGSDPAEIEGVAVHIEARDSAKIITKSRIFDFKLWSPKFLHISSNNKTPLFFFTETSSAGELASFVGVTCDSGTGSNLIKIPLKCSREDFIFAKMKQVVEIVSGVHNTFHILFSTPFNLYKKTTICSYSFTDHILPVLKPVLERCDPSQVANVVIAETPILEDRGSESDSGPYTSISTLWDNVLLLGTEGGELITAQRSTVDDPFLITLTRKLTHEKCGSAVLDLKSTFVDEVATVYVAFDTCITSVPISPCSSLDEDCCERTIFCQLADGICVPSLDEFAVSGKVSHCIPKESNSTIIEKEPLTPKTTIGPVIFKPISGIITEAQIRAQEDCIQEGLCPQNATIPVAIVGLIVAFVAFFGGYFCGKCSLKPQEYMDDSEWGITNTLSASSSSTAKTRTRIKTSPSKQSATLRSNRSDEGETARTIPVMGVSSIGSNRESTLSPRKSADGSTHESRA
ncbi:unnamed protein product [Oikopleura dioica]|uniref:Sema domain-containing protein n=1 Tax=Oikopleura dioica TaxID=34765 RepID=E4X0V7_OIKDI|nr:unnamed protein product [Oikopleura dioica]